MTTRNYVNGAPIQSLAVGVNTTDVTLEVSSTAGYPSAPFTLALERGTVNEEVVLCTALDATTFTVTRGWDSTTAKSHSSGAVVEHTTAAIDYVEANTHINASSDVHSQYPLKTAWTGKGVLMTASGAGTLAVLAAPSNNQVLLGDTAQTGGMKWGTIVAASITDGVITLAKLDSTLQKNVIQSVGSYPGSPSVGQEIYHTGDSRWYGYSASGWALRPYGIGKCTISTSSASGGSNGDIWFKYTP